MSETDGIQIAYSDALEAFPDWQSLSTLSGLRVAGWTLRRGRTDEFQRTGAGTASILVNDLTGELGADTELPTHVKITLRDAPMYRGFLRGKPAVVEHSGVVTRLSIDCVDAFDLFGRIEIADQFRFPGISSQRVWGNVPPATTADNGDVFYEDGQVDDRIIQVLANGKWSDDLRSIFSGNVNTQESVYAPGASMMQLLADAADAEFPDVSNLFMGGTGDYNGKVMFRGRFARFNPDAYGITRWRVGTGSRVTAGVAQTRELEWADGTDQIYNIALCYPDPEGHPQKIVMADQLFTDQASVDKWGPHSWSAENLIILRHNANGNTGAEECQLFAAYIINNYAQPVPRVTKITLRSLLDRDARASATWAMMMGAEIGDIVELDTDWIGGTHFIEGITASAEELDGDIPNATVSYDLSPAAHWTVDPF